MTTLEQSAPIPGAVRRVGRNAAILAATNVFCRAGSIAVVPLILRAFSTAEYGQYSAAFAYAGLLGMLAYFGMNQIVVRDVSRGERSKGWVVFHCAALRMMLLVPAGAALALIGIAKGFTSRMWILCWLAFAVMSIDAVTGAIRASMQGGGRFGTVAAVQGVRKSAQWAIAIAVIMLGAGITWLAAGVVAASAVALAASAILGLERRDLSGVEFAPSYAGKMLRLAAPMGISAAFVAALANTDIWLLDWLKTSSDVALYKAAQVFKPVFVAQAVVWALMPLAFRLGKQSKRDLAKAGATAARFLIVTGAALAIGLVCGASRLVPLLAGEKYAASVAVFRVMGLALPFAFTSFLFLHLLTAVDKQIIAVYVFAGGLAVNVAVDLALIPSMGATGAMLGTLGAEIFMAVGSLVAVWRVIGPPLDGATLRACVAAVAAGCAAIVTQRLQIADMGIGALVLFGVLLAAFRAVDAKDVSLVKRSFLG
ncbi:MAG: flippase [Planctomycetota bacterium]|jgi:O-antigen/teichoic acid export membrane protein